MNTDFFAKGGALGKHGNKAFNGLSAAAIAFLYVNFVTKDDFTRHCDQCETKRSRIWQKVMDHEVALARRGVVGVPPHPNPLPQGGEGADLAVNP